MIRTFAGGALALALAACTAAEEQTAAPAEGEATSAAASDAAAVSAETSGQPAAEGGPRGFGPPGDQTLDQMLQRSRAMFARMDADGDGKVTSEEREALRAQREGGPGRGMGGGMMRADADGDGVITAAESEAQARSRFERLDADKDGVVTAEERRGAFERRGPG